MQRPPDKVTVTSGRSYRLIDHPSEVEVHIEALELASLFEQAALALAAISAEDSADVATQPPEPIALHAADGEALLVQWLNELIFRSEVNKCVYGDIHVHHASEHELRATIAGHCPRAPKTSVKAATWHGLTVTRNHGRCAATFVLDV